MSKQRRDKINIEADYDFLRKCFNNEDYNSVIQYTYDIYSDIGEPQLTKCEMRKNSKCVRIWDKQGKLITINIPNNNDKKTAAYFAYILSRIGGVNKNKICIYTDDHIRVTTKHKKEHANKSCKRTLEQLDTFLTEYQQPNKTYMNRETDEDAELLKIAGLEFLSEDISIDTPNLQDKQPIRWQQLSQNKKEDIESLVSLIAYSSKNLSLRQISEHIMQKANVIVSIPTLKKIISENQIKTIALQYDSQEYAILYNQEDEDIKDDYQIKEEYIIKLNNSDTLIEKRKISIDYEEIPEKEEIIVIENSQEWPFEDDRDFIGSYILEFRVDKKTGLLKPILKYF
ncbi:MAG: hypothetical protein J7K26_00170 [Candidatus Aenigmarchaeota archaeon]|nr:hypothetical protein [Candidatus Aenigmarchaeota archaeon]